MTILPRHKLYLAVSSAILTAQIVIAATAKSDLQLTIIGDTVPILLLLVAILALRENFRYSQGILPIFWKVFAGGAGTIVLSQAYWYFYDWRRVDSSPSPVPGDALFILAHVFFLSAIALRPHSACAARDIRTRSLDFVLLLAWWISLFAYFPLPWQWLLHDLVHYTPSAYYLSLIQHCAIIIAFLVLSARKSGTWRTFYLLFALAFVFLAGGNFLVNSAIDSGVYYAASFYDTPFLLGIYLLTWVAAMGPSLQPIEDATPDRELIQSVWTARIAMLCVLSLPLLALIGLYQKSVPASVANFRLKVIFEATFILSILVYLKLGLLARELVRSVKLTRESIESLRIVQRQVAHSEKLIALGRLAAGAAHEISNPLTAILGYSELLTDIPSLTADDRSRARSIQQQVHNAQSAVNSLRNFLRHNSAPPASAIVVDKNSPS